jgi:hypothetical protein
LPSLPSGPEFCAITFTPALVADTVTNNGYLYVSVNLHESCLPRSPTTGIYAKLVAPTIGEPSNNHCTADGEDENGNKPPSSGCTPAQVAQRSPPHACCVPTSLEPMTLGARNDAD